MERRLNMKARSILIAGFLLSSLFVFCIVLTKPFGRCDWEFPRLEGVDVEGAHIVSEGAYFRFWLSNNNSFPVHVIVYSTAQGADNLVVPSKGSIDYDVIAPQISGVYEQVTYKFSISGPSNVSTVDFTVLVLNAGFVQIFDLIGPILIVIGVVIIATVTIVILRRRRSLRKT